jgi:nucleoside-diphosphate-sugar epimerase
MNVLVTGAFGNIGSSTLTALLERGHTVRAFDLATRSNRRAARRWGKRITVVWGDLRSRIDTANAVRGMDAIIHLAFIIPKLSHTGVESEARPEWAEAINVGGMRNLILAARSQAQRPHFVFASSIHIYGFTQHLPPPRTADEELHPVEHYAWHKLACETMLRTSGLPWSILRLAAALPISLKPDTVLFDIPLDNRVEYIHTRDAGVAFANAVGREDLYRRTLLIGGGPRCQYIYRDFFRPVLEAMGIGMLPEEAFGSAPFATDWFDTRESQALLQYQKRTLADYIADMVNQLGWRRELAILFRPAVRAWMLRQSPHWRAAQASLSKRVAKKPASGM